MGTGNQLLAGQTDQGGEPLDQPVGLLPRERLVRHTPIPQKLQVVLVALHPARQVRRIGRSGRRRRRSPEGTPARGGRRPGRRRAPGARRPALPNPRLSIYRARPSSAAASLEPKTSSSLGTIDRIVCLERDPGSGITTPRPCPPAHVTVGVSTPNDPYRSSIRLCGARPWPVHLWCSPAHEIPGHVPILPARYSGGP